MTKQNNLVFENEFIKVYKDATLALREEGDLWRTAEFPHWASVSNELLLLQDKTQYLERQVNERNPHKFIPILLKELSEKEDAMRKLSGSGSSGVLCLGQAQGLREAIQLIKSRLPDLDLYTQF